MKTLTISCTLGAIGFILMICGGSAEDVALFLGIAIGRLLPVIFPEG